MVGETLWEVLMAIGAEQLSVSSNGSWWVKPSIDNGKLASLVLSVSSNGSWWVKLSQAVALRYHLRTFSILKRIVVGETHLCEFMFVFVTSFSILKRIVVGETGDIQVGALVGGLFQYPQTDRGG